MKSDDVRRMRERLGWTQEDLARELGVHRVTVARWETGEHSVPAPVAKLLARFAAERKSTKRRK